MHKLDPLASLRQAIWPLHQEIEALPIFSKLRSEDLTPSAYYQAMQLLARFYAEVEPALLKQSPNLAPNYQPRGPLCEQTLLRTGHNLPYRAAGDFTLPDQSAYWGCRYVIEGSALGGQVIYQFLRPRQDLDTEFWRIHGESAANWRLFQSRLQAALQDPEPLAVACHHARLTFQRLLGIARNQD